MPLDQCLWWGLLSTLSELLSSRLVTTLFRAWWTCKPLHVDHRRCTSTKTSQCLNAAFVLQPQGKGSSHHRCDYCADQRESLSLSAAATFNNVSAARSEEWKKSLKEIWKLTSEVPWETWRTNTWLFSFCSTLDWDDRTGWLVLKEGSYWDFFHLGLFCPVLEISTEMPNLFSV